VGGIYARNSKQVAGTKTRSKRLSEAEVEQSGKAMSANAAISHQTSPSDFPQTGMSVWAFRWTRIKVL